MDDATEKSLIKDLKLHARALGITDGAAEDFINATIKTVKKNLQKKTAVTSNDLTRIVKKELKKYNKDLAYVYEAQNLII